MKFVENQEQVRLRWRTNYIASKVKHRTAVTPSCNVTHTDINGGSVAI